MHTWNVLHLVRTLMTEHHGRGCLTSSITLEERAGLVEGGAVSAAVVLVEVGQSQVRVPFDARRDAARSDFQFFTDGRQMTALIAWLPGLGDDIPVHLYTVGAAVLERSHRLLRPYGRPVVESGIIVAASLVRDRSILDEFRRQGVRVVDARVEGRDTDTATLRRAAVDRTRMCRESVEQAVVEAWYAASAHDGFLAVDGTLANVRDTVDRARCAGIAKSHMTRYVEPPAHRTAFALPAGYRSNAFRIRSVSTPSRDRISWYLRLRSRTGAGREFGLVRIEIDAGAFGEHPGFYADLFSRSVLAESRPTSYPASRWDNHLYPIWACERYLASVMRTATLGHR